MYLDFFSLKKFPFRITPDPSMFFPGGSDGPGVVLNALVYAVTSGEGIVKVVGEVGSGKTMLCRMLEERLPDEVEIVYLANPSLSAKDIIYAIAFELDLDVDASTERLMVMHKLQDYLVKKHSEGGAVVVFIEEAQGMPIETLEEIRLLSNLETHRHKLMQIILFGQPELDKNLAGKNIRQLRERITHSFYLEPMTAQRTSDYLQYRMQAAGCPWPKIFTPKAEKLLCKASEGLTRRVNILADKSLMAAYASSSIQPGHEYGAIQQKVQAAHVRAAIRDSGYGKRFLWPWAGLAVSLAIIVMAAGLYPLWYPQITQLLDIAGSVGGPANTVQSEPAAELQASDSPPLQQATVAGNGPETAPLTVPAELSASVLPGSENLPGAANTQATEQIEQLELAPGPAETDSSELVAGNSAVGQNPVQTGLESNVDEQILQPDAAVQEEPSASEVPVAAADSAELAVATDIEQATVTPEQGDSLEQESSLELGDSLEQEDSLELVENTGESRIAVPEDLPQGNQSPAAEDSAFADLDGLIGIRARASGGWLQALAEKDGYTVQMASFPTSDQLMLEEYLQLLSLTSMINETYLCLISATSRLPQQWLVIHGDFNGVSRARAYIDSLPTYSRQYEPFVRNSSSIACLN